MKGWPYTLFFILLGTAGFSQDYHFSGFRPSLMFANPSYAALPSSPEIGITYRNQWPGIPATFVTYGASFVMPLERMSSGVGVNVLNDVQGNGVISRTYAGLTYGYKIEIGGDWSVAAGVGALYVFKRFNADELVFRSDILNDLGYSYGPVNLGNYTRSYPDFNVGAAISNARGFSAGVSVNHLTRPAETNGNVSNDRIPLKYAGFVTGRFGNSMSYTRVQLSFEPGIFFAQQEKSNELMWGMNTVISSAFVVGAWARQNLTFNYDAVIISLGILREKYNFLYSYDVNVKKLSFLSPKLGAHEVTFLYRLEYKGNVKGAVNCPY